MVTTEVANQLQISPSSAYEIFHHRLHFHKLVQGGIQDSLQHIIAVTVQTYVTGMGHMKLCWFPFS
jgi:hypothetical protein